MQVIVSFIPPEVFTAWQPLPKEAQNCEDGVTRYLLIHLFKFFRIDLRLALETNLQNSIHVFKRFHTLVETIKSSAFLRKLAFNLPILTNIFEIDHGQGSHHCTDVVFSHETISIEIINFKYQFHLLIEG